VKKGDEIGKDNKRAAEINGILGGDKTSLFLRQQKDKEGRRGLPFEWSKKGLLRVERGSKGGKPVAEKKSGGPLWWCGIIRKIINQTNMCGMKKGQENV